MSCEGCCEVRASGECHGHSVAKVEVECEGHSVGVGEEDWEDEVVVGWGEVEESGSG